MNGNLVVGPKIGAFWCADCQVYFSPITWQTTDKNDELHAWTPWPESLSEKPHCPHCGKQGS